MATEATLSKYKQNTLKIIMVALIGFAVYCIYDGFYNLKFIEKHTKDGVQDSTLVFNIKSPPYLIGATVLIGVYFFAIRNKKIIADDNELILEKQRIAYNSIEKIDKTNFDSKGYFFITYKDSQGNEKQLKISDRTYDNLSAILDELIAKIS